MIKNRFPVKLFVGAYFALLIAQPLHGWGGAIHSSITAAAFRQLQPWEQDLWAGQREALVNQYCLIPDLARGSTDMRRQFSRYVLLPDGDPFSHQPLERQYNARLMEHLIDAALRHLKAGELDEAARYTGSLVHFLEDSSCPAHVMPDDNQFGLVKDLIPVPPDFQDRGLHTPIESGVITVGISGYKPRLLGTGAAEATSNLVERLNLAVRTARGQIIPILQGLFNGDKRAIDTGRLRAATLGAQAVADAMHTILSIADEKFAPQELEELETIDVAGLTPLEMIRQSYFPQAAFFSAPYSGFPVVNGILEKGMTRRPLALRILEGNNATIRGFEGGIGLGTPSRLTYVLPYKIYDRLECYVGLHPSLGKEGRVVFKIYGDGQAVYDSRAMSGEEPAQKVSLPVSHFRDICITVDDRGGERNQNYAIIGQPILHKAKATVSRSAGARR